MVNLTMLQLPAQREWKVDGHAMTITLLRSTAATQAPAPISEYAVKSTS